MERRTYILQTVFASLCLGTVSLTAQNAKEQPSISFENNAVRLGDEMQVVELQYPEDLYDLTNASEIGKFTERICQFSSDTTTSVAKGMRHHYLQSSKGLYIAGVESPLFLINYSVPEKKMPFPFSPKDSIHGSYYGEGTYCDKLYIKQFGYYQTKAEEGKSIVLPDGSQMDNVMQVHTIRRFQIETYPIDTLLTNVFSVTTAANKDLQFVNAAPVYKEEIYELYVLGNRYPVLEAYTCKDDKQSVLAEHCYFRSPEEQEKAGLDEPNQKLRESLVAAKGFDGELAEEDRGDTDLNEGKTPYLFNYDSGSSVISIRLLNGETAAVEIIVADTKGIVYKQSQYRNAKGSDTFRVNCASLPPRQYAVYISVGENKFCEKFNKK